MEQMTAAVACKKTVPSVWPPMLIRAANDAFSAWRSCLFFDLQIVQFATPTRSESGCIKLHDPEGHGVRIHS